MFFVLSKVLGFFALPSNLMVALGLAGLLVMATRRRRVGAAMVVVSLLLIAGFGLLPFGKALIAPLENRFPPWSEGSGPIAGIVVLGGAIDPDFTAAHGIDLNEAAERLTVIPQLARTYPAARIIYSGGNGRLVLRDRSEAEVAAPLIESFGVPADRLTLEDKSRNTWENAVYSKALARPQPGERWLLVTSASHMPRAIGSFRQAGFEVEAYPVDYRVRGPEDLFIPFEDVARGLRRTDAATREWIGLVAYWLTGKSSALFPAPRTRS
jgi:uncharacterized SAM-binding protein YcdF (DUF218 family)